MVFWVFLLFYLPITFTFGATLLEYSMKCLNRWVWPDDPADIPSPERFLAAWAVQNLQPFGIGIVHVALSDFIGSIGQPLPLTVAELGLPLLAVTATVPPLATALGPCLGLPVARALPLTALCTTLMLAASVALVLALVGLLLAQR